MGPGPPPHPTCSSCCATPWLRTVKRPGDADPHPAPRATRAGLETPGARLMVGVLYRLTGHRTRLRSPGPQRPDGERATRKPRLLLR